MFTLSGAHVFPMYDGAVKADPPMRLLDVRHEQTAVFAAEADRQADPGAGARGAHRRARVSPTASARSRRRTSAARRWSSSAAGRPHNRWGTGSLQELDQAPLLAPVTKLAAHGPRRRRVGRRGGRRLHPGPAPAPRSGLPRRADGRCSSRPGRRRAPARAAPGGVDAGPRGARRGSARCWPRRRGRCSSSAATCGPTAPRRRRCGSWRAPASRRSPTGWAAASSPAVTRCS